MILVMVSDVTNYYWVALLRHITCLACPVHPPVCPIKGPDLKA